MIQENVPLADWTTLGVGGPARYFVEARTVKELCEGLDFARKAGVEAYLLGGGSNLLVADSGYPGLVIRFADDQVEKVDEEGAWVHYRVGAGKNWDQLVAESVEQDLAGIECLSGIPGLVGAAPIQNIGAYGQEVAEVVESVEVLERATGRRTFLARRQCGFSYRHSHFKGQWNGLFVVLALHLRLQRGGAPTIRYGDLKRRLRDHRPTLKEVRETVLEVRRSKSMVYDQSDPNHRSAGSFFTNPIVSDQEAETVVERLAAKGVTDSLPRYPVEDGRVKLSAAWLIERVGFEKGYRHGAAGLSTNHVLALTNRGGASSKELIELAAVIRYQVKDTVGVELVPEPNFLGFNKTTLELLDSLSGTLPLGDEISN